MMLIDAYPEGLKTKDRAGNLALHSVLENRFAFPTSVVEKMLAVNPGATKVADKDGNLPLHCAFNTRTDSQLVELTKILLATDSSAGLVKSKKFRSYLLHYCCKKKKPLALVEIFCKGCPKAATLKDSGGNLPLHVLCELGETYYTGPAPVQIIQCLISCYPDGILIKDKDGNTPLHSAVETLHKNVSVVACAMIDARPKAAEVRDRDGNLPLHSIFESTTPATDVIIKLIDSYPGGLRVMDKDGNLPLHSAIERGDGIAVTILEKMIRLYPEACVKKDKEKNTPLHSACECRTKDLPKIVKLLLDADTKGVAAKTRDREGNLPIHSAAEKKNPSPEVVMMLIDAYPEGLKTKDRDGNLALHSAVENRFEFPAKVYSKMLAVNPGAMKITDKERNTPLHSACENISSAKIIEVLTLMLSLEEGRSAATIRDKDGNLAIHSASESKKLSGKVQAMVVDMLVDAYPGSLKIKDRDGNLPLHSAIERGDVLPVKVLAKMVQLYPGAVHVVDKEKNTPLHSACECRTKDLPKIIKLLLDADPKAVASKLKDKDGQLPVHSAINRRTPSTIVVAMMVEASPQCLEVKNKRTGVHIVQWAIDTSALDVLKKISQVSPQSFDVQCCKSSVSKKMEMPLHYVCYDKPHVSPQTMHLLANVGNALNTKNSKGKLPLRILYEEGRGKNLIECLKAAMGTTAFDNMFGDAVVDSGQVVIR